MVGPWWGGRAPAADRRGGRPAGAGRHSRPGDGAAAPCARVAGAGSPDRGLQRQPRVLAADGARPARADAFPMTREFLALRACAHRPGVTVAARLLRQAGPVRDGQGRMVITGCPGLEATACEGHGAVWDRSSFCLARGPGRGVLRPAARGRPAPFCLGSKGSLRGAGPAWGWRGQGRGRRARSGRSAAGAGLCAGSPLKGFRNVMGC